MLDLTTVLSTAGWILYRTDPTERSDFRKTEWQRAGDLPEGHVPKVWRGGRGRDPSSPPYSQAPGPSPCALHQHSGSQGNSQKPPPYLRHGQHHPCPARHQRWVLRRLLPTVGLWQRWYTQMPIGARQVIRFMISHLKPLGQVCFWHQNFTESLWYRYGFCFVLFF